MHPSSEPQGAQSALHAGPLLFPLGVSSSSLSTFVHITGAPFGGPRSRCHMATWQVETVVHTLCVILLLRFSSAQSLEWLQLHGAPGLHAPPRCWRG